MFRPFFARVFVLYCIADGNIMRNKNENENENENDNRKKSKNAKTILEVTLFERCNYPLTGGCNVCFVLCAAGRTRHFLQDTE